jgi:hypothetical protein
LNKETNWQKKKYSFHLHRYPFSCILLKEEVKVLGQYLAQIYGALRYGTFVVKWLRAVIQCPQVAPKHLGVHGRPG